MFLNLNIVSLKDLKNTSKKHTKSVQFLLSIFLVLALTACGADSKSDNEASPNDASGTVIDTPKEDKEDSVVDVPKDDKEDSVVDVPKDDKEVITPEDSDTGAPVLSGVWSEPSKLTIDVFSPKLPVAWKTPATVADDAGNIFYAWSEKGFWVARNTVEGWETPEKLSDNYINEFRWTVTPKGDAFVIWTEGTLGAKNLELKFAQYLVDSKTWLPAETLTSYSATKVESDKKVGNKKSTRIQEFIELKNVFINIDVNGDVLITWQQRTRVSLVDAKPTSYSLKYEYTEFVNQQYIQDSGFKSANVFWTSLSKTESEMIDDARYYEDIRFDLAYIENVALSAQKVFVVTKVMGGYLDVDKHKSFQALTCGGTRCTNETVASKVLMDVDPDLTSTLYFNLSVNSESLAFVTFYHDGAQRGVHYQPDTGWGATKSIELEVGSGIYAMAPVSIIDNNGRGYIAWNSSKNSKLYVNGFISGANWQDENTVLEDRSINNYIHLSKSSRNVPYAMWHFDGYDAEAQSHKKYFVIKGYSQGKGWQALPKLEHDITGSTTPYQLAYDNKGNPIAIWNIHERKEDYSIETALRVSRFIPNNQY